MFQRNMLPSSAGQKSKMNIKNMDHPGSGFQYSFSQYPNHFSMLGLPFYPEDGGSRFL
jgi:hypothetical protein